MTSFTKQLRAGTGAFARENIDALTEMAPAEVEATLAEPLAAEIEQDVVAPVANIETGNDALMEAEADASMLENTAAVLEDATGDDVTDVDQATSELANITVERIATKYNLDRSVKISTEGFASAISRKHLAESISKEAFEKAGELRKRVTEGIKKLIEWFKNLIKSVFGKRAKLAKRCHAVVMATAQKMKSGYTPKEGAELVLDKQYHAINGKTTSTIGDLVDGGVWTGLVGGLKELGSLSKKIISTETLEDQSYDFNPSRLGGKVIKLQIENGIVRPEITNEPAGDSVTVPVLTLKEMTSIGMWTRIALDEMEKAESTISDFTSSLDRAVAYLGRTEEENAKAQSTALANFNAMSRIPAAATAMMVTVLMGVITLCEQSLAAHEKPAA